MGLKYQRNSVVLHEVHWVWWLLAHCKNLKSKWGGHAENTSTSFSTFLSEHAGRVYWNLVSPLSGLCSSPPCLQALRDWGRVCEKQPQLWSTAPVLSGEEKPWAFGTIQPLWNYWKPSAKNQMTVDRRYKPDVGIPTPFQRAPAQLNSSPSSLVVAARGRGHAAGIALLQQMTCLSSSSVQIT